MQFAVIKWDQSTRREVGINADGTVASDLDQAELMPRELADRTARQHGGTVVADSRLFVDFTEAEDFD